MKYWFKNTVIYSVTTDAFQDSNGDGCGDLLGLVDRLEYISSIGINTIWLLPIFKTPNRDNGYDVQDYFSVDERLGNLGAFTEFMARCEEHHMNVILDLPINHTSDQHFWFQEARNDAKSKYRDFYIWAEERPENHDQKLIFGEEQGSNWKYDKVAKSWFYHTFYDFQPDLNFANPAVRKEIKHIMHFWLRLGVSGFRIDALSHVIESKGSNFIKDPVKIIREFRQYTEEISCEAILLGETDVEPKMYKDYFGRDNKFQMLLNFYLSNYIFSALAKKQKSPIEYALDMLPRANDFQQYANFLRNHDELDLERLNDSEREEVFKAFAPDENMRVFGRGIRRRLAPMFNNDRRMLELAYSILFSMPGSPIIRYGDELGMGDDLAQKDRNSVRTVMQWSNEGNAGFSSAPEKELIKPVIKKGIYGKDKLNVELQFKDDNSFLNWMVKLIRMRKKCLEFGRGNYFIVDTGHPAVLCHYCKFEHEIALAVHNFSDEEVNVVIVLSNDSVKRLVHVFGDKDYELLEKNKEDKWEIDVSPLGYRWFQGRVEKEGIR